jgi:hypothetical protein
VTGGGSDDEGADSVPPRPRPPEAAGVFNDPRVGVVVSRPEGWTARRRRRAVRLRSRDRSVVVSISSPGRASQVEGVLDSALAALEEEYDDVEAGRPTEARIAGRPALSAVVSATSSRGTALRVVVAAVRGRRRAYLVEVFTARNVSETRLAEAQTVLNSLRLGK